MSQPIIMRQIISVLLLFSVLVGSTGFTLAKHFCGETLAHISLGDEAKTCCEPEEEMPSDCCHDEFESLLLDDSQLDHQTLQLQPLTFLALSVLTHYLSFLAETTVPASQWTVYPPPPLPGIDVYLRVQSFLL